MNLYKSIIIITIAFITIFCSIFEANANGLIIKTELNSTVQSTIEKVDGGPRTVIQFMTSVTIIQPVGTDLYLTVVKPNGEILLEHTSKELQTEISTKGWAAGEYTIETTDDQNVYQEFVIQIK